MLGVRQAFADRDRGELAPLAREARDEVLEDRLARVHLRDHRGAPRENVDRAVVGHVERVVGVAVPGPQHVRVAVQAHDAERGEDRQQAAPGQRVRAAPRRAPHRVARAARPGVLEAPRPAVHHAALEVHQHGFGGVRRDHQVEPGHGAPLVVQRDAGDLRGELVAAGVAELLEVADPRIERGLGWLLRLGRQRGGGAGGAGSAPSPQAPAATSAIHSQAAGERPMKRGLYRRRDRGRRGSGLGQAVDLERRAGAAEARTLRNIGCVQERRGASRMPSERTCD